MILRIAVGLFVLVAFASALYPHHGEAQDHQPASADVEKLSVPASVVSASPSLPTPSPKAEQRDDESWNYWDAIAPPTWNGWALCMAAGIAAWIAIRTLSKIDAQVRTEQTSLDLMRTEYAATHRPQIRVRSFDIALGEIEPTQGDKLCQTRVGFYVVNYGESDAILVNAQYSVIINEQLPMVPSYQSEFISNLNRLKPKLTSAKEPESPSPASNIPCMTSSETIAR